MITLKAEPRTYLGKKVKTLRKKGLIPATVYGPGIRSESVSLNHKDFQKVFDDAKFTNFIDLYLEDSKPRKVLIKDVQIHPITQEILSVSLYQVNQNRKITTNVPIVLVGEAPVVKQNLGFLVQQLDTVALHCLPKDLPRFIEVNLSVLENIGDVITLASVTLPEGVEFDSGIDLSTTVVYVATSQKIETEGNQIPTTDSSTADANQA